ncbi:phosphotransferase family protein [Sphingobium sp. EM0848]|uniref:phosphotransferase family protein n=1 Tax=Sphingobium sp. EM0848 TaxID=2743473 RepID=UPI00159C5D77|nr:phosphotransferase family protein [Sphingobium sp. EM0848]
MDSAKILATLSAKAERLAPGGGAIEGLRQLSGGASMETWLFDVSGNGHSEKLILRREPDDRSADGRGIGLLREAALIAHVNKAQVPVPQIRHIFAPEDGIGTALVMTFIAGEALPQRIMRDPHHASAREAYARNAGHILAEIHALDWQNLGLPLQQPAAMVADLESRYRQTSIRRPVFEYAFRWLADNMPPPVGQPTLVHGDFRTGNLMLGPDSIIGVLDWEVCHVGDPVEDLAWLCMPSWRFGALDKPVGGIGQFADLENAYTAASGRRIDPARFRFWSIVSLLRWGGMCADMGQWVLDGVDRSLERHVIARRASETELDLLVALDVRRSLDGGIADA